MDLDTFIREAIREDIGDGDHTSLATIPVGSTGKAILLVKEPGILSGVDVAQKIFGITDPSVTLDIQFNDGERIEPGQVVFEATGNVQSLLKTERLMLNMMQRMSGIATVTARYVEAVKGTKARILDTRKTTPNLRMFEKMAVAHGGGVNHRFGLFDMIMIKDNHIDYAGGIEPAISRVTEYLKQTGKDLRIEIEARNLDEVEQILRTGKGHRIMLDNFDYADTRTAVKLIAGRYETESSGGITLETVREYARCGVDYISVGALTHSVKSLDLSFKAV